MMMLPLASLRGGFHRVGQTLADTVLDHESVDHDLDGVLLLLGEFDVVGQLCHLAVDERAGVAVGRSSSIISTNSPLRPLTTGERIWNRVRSG